MVTDMSWAEITAVIDAFNNIDVVEYLKRAHKFVNKRGKFQVNVTLNLCYGHLMHMLSRELKKLFGKRQIRVRRTLLEILADIVHCRKYSDLLNKVKLLFTILQSEDLNQNV